MDQNVADGGFYLFFFFSSRRRHTRLQGDWSSDVCSSDLLGWKLLFQHEVVVIVIAQGPPKKDNTLVRQRHNRVLQRMLFFFRCNAHAEIGRASCRERV